MAVATKAPAKKEATAPAKKKSGRVSNDPLPENVGKLLKMLAEEGDDGKKRRIRGKLRAMGHAGGLGKKTEGGKKKAKAGKRKAKAEEEDDDEEVPEEEDDTDEAPEEEEDEEEDDE